MQSRLQRETEAPSWLHECIVKLSPAEREAGGETGASRLLIVQGTDPLLRTLKEITFFFFFVMSLPLSIVTTFLILRECKCPDMASFYNKFWSFVPCTHI